MDSFETLKRRIRVTQELHSIVRTMKSLAGVNLRQYERALESLGCYRRGVELGLGAVLRDPEEEPSLRAPGVSGRLGALVFGSDQGLCGQFNERIASYAIAELHAAGPGPHPAVIAIGQRPVPFLEEAGLTPDLVLPVPGTIAGITPSVRELLLQFDRWQISEKVERISLFHHRPLSSATCKPIRLELVPLDVAWLRELRGRPWPGPTPPAYTMPWRELFGALVREHLFVSLYGAFAESIASENAARLTAMQAAERNIDDASRALRTEFQEQRQSAITAELLDIVAGAEAQAQADHAG